MELVNRRYIDDIRFNELGYKLNIIQAHQGAGKTERIKDLKDGRTLVVGHRRELGVQLIDRCKGMDFGYYEALSRKQLHTWKNLFICYPSIQKLKGRNFTKNGFDYLVIDETNEVWADAFKFQPKNKNYQMLQNLFYYIPIKIIIGAHFPEYVLKDIDRLAGMDTGTIE